MMGRVTAAVLALLDQGRAALRAGDAATARAAFEQVMAEQPLGMFEPDRTRKEGFYEEALLVARRTGDRELEFATLAYLGASRVHADRTEEGMVLLDEALAAVAGSEVDDFCVLEEIFCQLFSACEYAHDVTRADEWIQVGEATARRRRLPAVSAFCRTHYGGLLTTAGRWPEAEAALTEAVRLWGLGQRSLRVGALVRLADLRVRQGRLEEAEQLLDGLDTDAEAARPLAAVHLARGQTALAKGRVCLASGDGDPRHCLREALAGFARAQMPMEAARSLLELASAVLAEHPEVAAAEARAALETFERLRAARHVDAAAAVLRTLGVRTPLRGESAAPGLALQLAHKRGAAVTAFNSVQHATDPVAALRELRRVAAPTAAVAVVTWATPERCETRTVLAAIGGLLPPPPPGAGGPFALSVPGALEALVTEAGLAPVRAGEAPAPFSYPDLDTAVRRTSRPVPPGGRSSTPEWTPLPYGRAEGHRDTA